METKKENQALTAPAPLTDDYRQIAHLIGSIFFAGDFKAETANERELEALLIKTGHRYASWDEVVAQAAPAPQQSELSEQLEAIARTWDGHLTEDSHGEEFDIGRDLRNDFAKLNLAKAAPAAPVQTIRQVGNSDHAARVWMEDHGYGNQSFEYALYDLQSRIDAKDAELQKLAAPVQTALTESELNGLAQLADRIEEANEKPMVIARSAARAIDKLLSLAAPVQAEQAQAEPSAHLYEYIGDPGYRKFGALIARTPDELGGNIDLYPTSWKRLGPLYAAPVAALPAQAEQAAAVRAAYENAANVLEAMNDASGDAAAYDNREQNIYELEREHAIADCVKKVRALAKEAAIQAPSQQGESK